ncbi:MAG TPA: GNAT family N-acetyltransferase [Egibacteraceae bacterium]
MSLQIRDARDDELDIVASLSVDAYAEYAARMSPDAWSSFAQDIANVRGRLPDADLLVAELDGKLVGAVTMFTDWRGAQADSVGVRLLAVIPEARGKGIGRALMEEVIARARARDKRRVVLTIAPEMESVKELSEELGFEREPDLDHVPAPGVRSEGYALSLDGP